MKVVNLLSFAAVAFTGVLPAAQDGLKTTINVSRAGVVEMRLDGDWRFAPAIGKLSAGRETPGEVDAAARLIGDGASEAGIEGWSEIRVPQFLNRINWWVSDVSAEYEQKETIRVENLPSDAVKAKSGWYLKTFILPDIEGSTPKEVYVTFEGVAMVSRVYCNGEFVGGQTGMFGEFSCRLTEAVKWGGENRLVVFVQRGVDEKGKDEVIGTAVTVQVTKGMFTSLSRGMFGGFGRGSTAKFMGIWQPVTLKISEGGGKIMDVFFNPSLTGHKIEMTVQNPGHSSIEGHLSYQVKAKKDGRIIAEEELEAMALPAGESRTIVAEKSSLSPVLWTPDTPNLYDLKVEWKDSSKKLIDSVRYDVGYRTVEIRGARVFLNGHPYWSRGANMPPYGNMVNDEAMATGWLQSMKDGNTVITRTHGGPWNSLWLGLADKIGIGVSFEGVRPWALMSKQAPPPEAIIRHWKEEQLASIRQYRNHPSILFYCISNEGLQGDQENPQKLKIFGDLIAEIRKADPSRPIFQTSGEEDASGNADMEDIHSYWGWYKPSSYVNDYRKQSGGNTTDGKRPFINQEMAVPYQETDNGGVLPTYIKRYMSQPWVGDLGSKGGDPSYFSEHVRAEGKRKAEKQRYQTRDLPTAGVNLFANLTWIQHGMARPPSDWKPFPIWTAIKDSFVPVLAALETPQSVFYVESQVPTRIFIVNDDVYGNDRIALKAEISYRNMIGEDVGRQTFKLGEVPYYGVKSWPVTLDIPEVSGTAEEMINGTLEIRLFDDNGIVSKNNYPIRYASRKWAGTKLSGRRIAVRGVTMNVQKFLLDAGADVISDANLQKEADALLLGPDSGIVTEEIIKSILRPGARALLLENPEEVKALCGDVLMPSLPPTGTGKVKEKSLKENPTVEKVVGEFVEMLGWNGKLPLYQGLGAMDWKWWAISSEQPAFVTDTIYRVNTANPDVQPIGRYLSSHPYWQYDLDETYRWELGYPVFAVKKPWGEIVVCNLNFKRSVGIDPRADRTLANFITEPLPGK